MASTTRMRDRIFTGLGALLFLGSALAYTIFIMMSSNSTDPVTPTANTQNTCTAPTNTPVMAVPEIYKTDSPVTSLESTDLTQGNGAKAKDGDCLIVKYYGTLATTGVKFDETFTGPTAFAFKLGQGQVISGWDKGMVGMQAGGERRLVIPAAQAYGAQSPSADIPANSDLVFVVKLLEIKK